MTGAPGEDGFGLVEALVAMTILTIASLTALQLFGSFSRTWSLSRQRDAISTLVASDLAQLRSAVQSWCQVSDAGTSSCSGAIATQDRQGSYNPPADACDASTLAVAMVDSAPATFAATTTLTATSGDTAPLQGVEITRTITASGNLLEIAYATAAGAALPLNTRTTLVPAALGWCP